MLEYISRLITYLINQEAFLLVEDPVIWKGAEEYDNGGGPSAIKLGRQRSDSWQFIKIVEADGFNEKNIAEGIRQDVESFEELQHATWSSGVTCSTILVFQEGLSEEIAQRLLEFQHKSLWQNVHNLIWVVDLRNVTVYHRGSLRGKTILSEKLLTALIAHDIQIQQPESGQAPRPEAAPGKSPVITYALIGINVIMWSLMSMAGGSDNSIVLQAFGAKVNSLIIAGQYWRLLTPVFLHIGIEHLLFNCFALYQLGIGAEQLFGRFKYLVIYLVAGMFGNLGSFLFSDYLSAGASGAIFGIMGAYLYFGTRDRKVFSSGLGGSILAILVINLVYGLINDRVDNFAHLGGLIGGFLISSAVGLRWEKAFHGNRLVWLVVSVLLFVGLFQLGMTR